MTLSRLMAESRVSQFPHETEQIPLCNLIYLAIIHGTYTRYEGDYYEILYTLTHKHKRAKPIIYLHYDLTISILYRIIKSSF